MVPHRKLAIQQAFMTVDTHGDGYIGIEQFLRVFKLAGVDIDIQILEYLFDALAEKFMAYNESMEADEESAAISISYFMRKLFSNDEMIEINKIDSIFSKIKTAMIYKGISFTDVFGDLQEEDDFNIIQHFKTYRFALRPDDFCERILSLGISELTHNEVIRVANFLSMNQDEKKLIFCNNFLHHMRRISTNQFDRESEVKDLVSLISAKLLCNEDMLRDLMHEITPWKDLPEAEKFLENSDLRCLLTRYNICVQHQDIFIS